MIDLVEMNQILVIIALVAVTANMVCAAADIQKFLEQALSQQSPDNAGELQDFDRLANHQDDGDDADMQRFYSFLRDTMSQSQADDQLANEQDDDNLQAQEEIPDLKSFLATAEDDGDDAKMEAEIEKLFGKEPAPAEAQSYYTLYNRAKHFAMYTYHRFRYMYNFIAKYMPHLKRRYYYSVYGKKRYCKYVKRCYVGR